MTEVIDAAEVLPGDDCEFLQSNYPNRVIRHVGAELHVLLPGFPFPAAYAPGAADLLLRLPAGYPNAAPDMFWTKPDVKLTSGGWPRNCEHHEVPGSGLGVEIYSGVPWQRWSRHFGNGGWIVGRHGLQFFVGSIIRELQQGI